MLEGASERERVLCLRYLAAEPSHQRALSTASAATAAASTGGRRHRVLRHSPCELWSYYAVGICGVVRSVTACAPA